MDFYTIIFCIVILVVLCAIIAYYLSNYLASNIIKDTLRSTSHRLKHVHAVNKTQNFDHDPKPLELRYNCATSTEFEQFDPEAYLKQWIKNDAENMTAWKEAIHTNRTSWDSYVDEITDDVEVDHSEDQDLQLENELVQDAVLPKPTTELAAVVIWSYTDPIAMRSYSKRKKFGEQAIEAIIESAT